MNRQLELFTVMDVVIHGYCKLILSSGMDIYSELISGCYLSKNTSGIVISYLTELPKLPYIDELDKMINSMRGDSDWFYTNYYVDNLLRGRKEHIYRKVIVHRFKISNVTYWGHYYPN